MLEVTYEAFQDAGNCPREGWKGERGLVVVMGTESGNSMHVERYVHNKTQPLTFVFTQRPINTNLFGITIKGHVQFFDQSIVNNFRRHHKCCEKVCHWLFIVSFCHHLPVGRTNLFFYFDQKDWNIYPPFVIVETMLLYFSSPIFYNQS